MPRKKYPSDQYCYNVSFPPGAKEEIKKAAHDNYRTMNAEIVFRVLGFDPESNQDSLADITTRLQKVEKQLELITA
jgi:hypothetical protein